MATTPMSCASGRARSNGFPIAVAALLVGCLAMTLPAPAAVTYSKPSMRATTVLLPPGGRKLSEVLPSVDARL
jgi:hypothetical protein